MKSRAILSGLLLVGMIGMVGCDSKPAANDSGKKDAAKKTSQVTPNTPAVVAKTDEANSSTSGSAVDTSKLTLVALSVPNMTWGGCAASVRGDLAKITGVSDIETDTTATTAKFKVGKEVKDLQAQLDEFAKTNTHLAGYSFVEGKPSDNN